MLVVAITGGLGAGKTEATRFFEARGSVVLDLDTIAKDLLAPDSEVHDALVAAFGEDILDTDNLEITRFPRNGGTVVLALEN